MYPLGARLYCHVVFLSTLFSFLLSLLFARNFLGVGFFVFAERSPPPPPAVAPFHAFLPLACFLFVRQKISATPRLLRFFTRSFLPLWMFLSVSSTWCLIPVTTKYMLSSVPSFFFYNTRYCFSLRFRILVCLCCFPVFCSPVSVPQRYGSDGVIVNVQY